MFRHEHCDTLVLFLQCVIFTVLKAASLGRWSKSEKKLENASKRSDDEKKKEKMKTSKTVRIIKEESSSNLLKIS